MANYLKYQVVCVSADVAEIKCVPVKYHRLKVEQLALLNFHGPFELFVGSRGHARQCVGGFPMPPNTKATIRSHVEGLLKVKRLYMRWGRKPPECTPNEGIIVRYTDGAIFVENY